MKKTIPYFLFSSYQKVPFEDIELMVIKGSNDLLCSSYGEDYMTPKKWTDTQSEIHSVIRKDQIKSNKGKV